ncbi:MAG: anthranilate phosphoribosyltransferase [Acidimicrobiia bacterium]|nr:anthranilate phosphoribosyltransferase [Acidimicrobiia bacterium]
MTFLDLLHSAVEGPLDAAQAEQAMSLLLEGNASPAQTAAFLTALRVRGETGEEVAGFARAMRARVNPVDPGPGPVIDTCGTGGDGQGTFNVSTVAAFVAAGAGARVAKHGNRSISSQCGSADILEALGVKITLDPAQMGQCIRETGIGFLFAPALHPAMKHAQPIRVELKMRTVFNMLGPLTNPAGAEAQLIGAWSPLAAELMAQALLQLGLKRGFVVHGHDGMDEITTTSATLAFEIRDGALDRIELHPDDFGIRIARPADLRGGDRESNTTIARAVLNGEKGPRRDIVLVNAAAALVASGHAEDFRQAMSLAAESLDSGAARKKLETLAEFTHRL